MTWKFNVGGKAVRDGLSDYLVFPRAIGAASQQQGSTRYIEKQFVNRFDVA